MLHSSLSARLDTRLALRRTATSILRPTPMVRTYVVTMTAEVAGRSSSFPCSTISSCTERPVAGDRPHRLQDRSQTRRGGGRAGADHGAECGSGGGNGGQAHRLGGYQGGATDLRRQCDRGYGSVSPSCRRSRSGAGQSRSHADSLAGQRLGDKSAGAGRRLRHGWPQCDFRSSMPTPSGSMPISRKRNSPPLARAIPPRSS